MVWRACKNCQVSRALKSSLTNPTRSVIPAKAGNQLSTDRAQGLGPCRTSAPVVHRLAADPWISASAGMTPWTSMAPRTSHPLLNAVFADALLQEILKSP